MTRLLQSNWRHAPGPGDRRPANPPEYVCDRCREPLDQDIVAAAVAGYRLRGEEGPTYCDVCSPCTDCGSEGHDPGTDGCPWEVA